jgi:hypothetical protein
MRAVVRSRPGRNLPLINHTAPAYAPVFFTSVTGDWRMHALSGVEAREHRLRQTAYHLWEQAGRPHGKADEHWAKAIEMERADEAERPAPLAKSRQKKKSVSKKQTQA